MDSKQLNIAVSVSADQVGAGMSKAEAEINAAMGAIADSSQKASERVAFNFKSIQTAYNTSVKAAQKAAMEYGLQSDQFKKAAITASVYANSLDEVNAKMMQVDQAIRGNAGVADIASKRFNMMGYSIAQITREMPAFAMSAQMGFLAISNNIPLLVDEINRLKIANNDLVKSGGAAIPIWRQVGSALFSWQTALSVGVTLLTIFGGKLIDVFASSKKAAEGIDALNTAQKSLNDRLQEYLMSDMQKAINAENEAYQKLVDELKIVDNIKNSTFQTYQEGTTNLANHLRDRANSSSEFYSKIESLEKQHQENLDKIRSQYSGKISKTKEQKQLEVEVLPYEIKPKINLRDSLEKILGPKGVLEIKVPIKIDESQFVNNLARIDKIYADFSQNLRAIGYQIAGDFAYTFGEALSGSADDFGKEIMSVIAQAASQIGSALIALGTILLAVGLPNGGAYVAAGIGLKFLAGVISGAVNARSSSAAQNNYGNGFAGANYGSPTFSSMSTVVEVGGMVRGDDLRIVLNNNNRQVKRVR